MKHGCRAKPLYSLLVPQIFHKHWKNSLFVQTLCLSINMNKQRVLWYFPKWPIDGSFSFPDPNVR